MRLVVRGGVTQAPHVRGNVCVAASRPYSPCRLQGSVMELGEELRLQIRQESAMPFKQGQLEDNVSMKWVMKTQHPQPNQSGQN